MPCGVAENKRKVSQGNENKWSEILEGYRIYIYDSGIL